MSTTSELKARFERLGPVQVVSPPRLTSDQQCVVLLRRTGPLDQPVSIIRRLMAACASMRVGRDVVNRLAAEGWAVCTVSRHEDIEALSRDLAVLNVQLRRRLSHAVGAADVTRLRTTMGLSQREYADLLGMDVRTLQNWEQGRNRPDPAAVSLMRLFAHAPEMVEDVLTEPVA